MGDDSRLDINDPNRGNTVIRAQDINIDNVMDVYTNQSEQKFKQSGLTVSVSNSLIDSAKSIDNLIDAGGNTGSTRMKGMASVAAALKTKSLAAEANSAGYDLLDGNLKGVGNTRIQATIGSSKSQSNSSSYTEANQGSSTTTNNLALIATGAGTDSDININGSSLTVNKDALFQVDNDLTINGVAQNSNTRSDNKSSSTAIGAYAATNPGKDASYGITASASRAKGYANSDSTTYANSQVNVGGNTTLDIGNDLNIKGGVLNTDKIQGVIGGDMTIESLQDTATYDSDQKNMGFSADLDLAKGTGSSLSVNGGKTNVNADSKIVNEQSGIFSNEADLVAEGKGTFKGGVFVTSKEAQTNGKSNIVFKQGVSSQDIKNTTSYEGEALSIGLSIGNTTGKPQATMNGIGYGTDSDSDSSITKGGVSGYSDPQGMLTTDNREALGGKLESVFDAQRVNEELGAQTQITQEFGKEAPKAVAEFSQNRIDAIKDDTTLSIDEKLEAIKKWDEGGIYRVAAHTALGALGTGSVEGALTTGGVATAAPTLDNLQKKISDALVANGMSEDIAKGTANGVISLALLGTGSAVGLDTSSTVTATNVDANNRWLHTSELNQIFADGGKKIKEFAKAQGISYEEAWRAIVAQAYRNTDDKFRESHTPKPGTKESRLAQASEIFLRKNALITSTAAERANSSMNRNSGNILKQVEANTPSYTKGQKNLEVLKKVGNISAEGAAKGIGNIPSDTANAYTNVIGKEVPRSFPYNSEEAENVGTVVQNVAGVVITIGGIKVNAKRGQNNTSNTNGATNRADVWNMSNQFERGRKIEDDLAVTEYSSWQKTDNFIDPKTNQPFKTDNFPLVDFQKGQNVVSVKSANTTGSGWNNALQNHIQQLGRTDITVSGKPVSKILDVRVQPGGFNDAKPLIKYGIRRNVAVVIKEYK
ncbi:hemagglutinin repeat-containing protein [Psychrobacter sp.]|uniref:hemagglutinin repeat-containing protein n=1 Tax=Psychrobacter sp. TaxID=56811 RepID=UPI0035697226